MSKREVVRLTPIQFNNYINKSSKILNDVYGDESKGQNKRSPKKTFNAGGLKG